MVLGVLGGLGPGATVHFMDRLVEMTPAASDQDHIETIVYNDPTVPDRTDAILGDGLSPKDQLVENAKTLDSAGCDAIVIDSNTTHYYHNAIDSAVNAEIPHLMSLVEQYLKKEEIHSVGVLTTEPAIQMDLYENVAKDVVYPDNTGLLMEAMYLYKAGKQERAANKYRDAAQTVPSYVDGYVIGCTDFSALNASLSKPTVDALDILVRWCVKSTGNL
jgi:aspartate racemase